MQLQNVSELGYCGNKLLSRIHYILVVNHKQASLQNRKYKDDFYRSSLLFFATYSSFPKHIRITQ
jgi:hypothetical protein